MRIAAMAAILFRFQAEPRPLPAVYWHARRQCG